MRLEFWYEFASPYSYLAASRIEAAVAGLAIEWRPFLLGPIFARRRHNPAPFQDAEPAEARYRRRDAERLAAEHDVALRWPSVYPRNGLLAARVALIAADEGWCPAFTRAVYRANFAEDRDIADRAVIGGILREFGREDALTRAETLANKRRLADQVEAAVARGIFGAPSFIADGELFWGNDRLDQAIRWAKQGGAT